MKNRLIKGVNVLGGCAAAGLLGYIACGIYAPYSNIEVDVGASYQNLGDFIEAETRWAGVERFVHTTNIFLMGRIIGTGTRDRLIKDSVRDRQEIDHD